jgi:hypothetical protein
MNIHKPKPGLGMRKGASMIPRQKNEGIDFLLNETDQEKIKMAEEIG